MGGGRWSGGEVSGRGEEVVGKWVRGARWSGGGVSYGCDEAVAWWVRRARWWWC